MGCPPDPGDVSIWRSNEQRSEAEIKLKELASQKEISLSLLEKIKPLLPSGHDFSELLDEIHTAIDEPPVKTGPVYGDPNDPYSYRDVQEASVLLDKTKQELKNKENSLCIIRDGLLKLSSFIQPGKLSAELTAAIRNEHSLHLEHREDDRRTWIGWIDNRLITFSYYLNKAIAKEKTAEISYLKEGIQKLEKEKARVQKLRPEDLVLNRTIFGQNEVDLDISFSRIKSLSI
ncbi:MAG: hypothetical protein ACJ75J_14640 [Cytophagaceae bacterium]